VVRQAIHGTYTYYESDGTVRVVRDEPLDGRGRAWVDGAYEPPVYPGPLSVRVGEGGVKVWTVIKWLRFYEDNVDRVVAAAYQPLLSSEDVEAARNYYEQNKEANRS
jgi:uncharacterized protein (DUF433 family)